MDKILFYSNNKLKQGKRGKTNCKMIIYLFIRHPGFIRSQVLRLKSPDHLKTGPNRYGVIIL